MSKQNFHHTKFIVGEYSKAGLARTDVEAKTPYAAEVQENILPSIIGKGQVRPGTEYLDDTNASNRARLIPFIRDISDSALLEMTDGALRIMHDDAFISRADVATTITNGDFSSGSGWTLSATSGASSTVTGGKLVMHANGKGSEAYAEQMITVALSDYGKEHGIRIVVDRGPVRFRVGTSSGYQNAVAEQILYAGTHSFSITPTASYGQNYYIRVLTRFERTSKVDSITIEPEGIVELEAPWTEAELREVSYDQQSDVIVFAHKNWQPRQLERRGTRSWSLVLFTTDNGPVDRLFNGKRMKLNSTRNNTTVTCDEDFFTPGMVGGIIRIYHDNLDADYAISGDDQWTDTFRVAGIKGEYSNDRKFYYSISGSWTGTLNIQRSVSGEDGDYLDFNYDESTTASDITSNRTNTHLGNEEDNNVLAYHRIGFKEGNYGSGTAVIRIIYQGQSGYGWGRITEYYGPRSVGLEVIDQFKNTNWTTAWEIGSWGTFVPWPDAVCFHDNRLFFAGRDRVWASAINNFNDFDDLDFSDLATFTRSLGSGGNSSSAKWMLPLQRLIVGTEGSSVSIRSGEFDDTLTLNNVTMRDCSTVGANYVSPIKLDSRGMFVHQSGSDVYDLKPGKADYEAERTTVYNEDICKAGIVELSAQREPDTLVWCVRTDGQVPVIMYEHEGDASLKCWNRFITAGDVESVCVLPGQNEDRVYLSVNRSIAEDIAPETGAEELAPNSGDAFAIDFTDQSVYVADAATPANNRNEVGSIGDYGVEEGPDALFINGTNAKLTRQANGWLAYQPHNLAPNDSDFTDAGWTNVNLTVINDEFQAPDGTLTAQRMRFTDVGGADRRWFEIPIPGAADTSTPLEFEVGFYWYNPTVTVSRYPCIQVGDFGDYDYAGDYAHLDYDLNYIGEGFETYYKQVGTTYAVPGQTANTYIDPKYGSTDLGNGWKYIRAVFTSTSAQAAVRIGVEGNWSSSTYYFRLWGVQINYIPTAEYTQGLPTPLVKNDTGAAKYLLPYAWDADGNSQGILSETASQNLLTASDDFEDAAYVAEGLSVQSGGTDSGPTAQFIASRFLEDGTGVQRHGVYQVITGPSGQYAGSVFIKRSSIGWVALRLEDFVGNSYLASFNTTTGDLDLESNDGLTNVAAGVEEYAGNQWRIWITATMDPTPPADFDITGTATTAWVALDQPHFEIAGAAATSWEGGSNQADWSSSASASATWEGTSFYTEPEINIILNGSFESGTGTFITSWTNQSSGATVRSGTTNGLAPQDGSNYLIGGSSFQYTVYQYGDLQLAFTPAEISAGSAVIDISAWYAKDILTGEQNYFRAFFYNSSFSFVSTIQGGIFLNAPTEDTWYEYTITGVAVPTTARYVRIMLDGTQLSGPSNAAWDNIVVSRASTGETAEGDWSSTGAATAAFVGLNELGIWTSNASDSATWAGTWIAEADIVSSPSASVDWVPNVGVMTSTNTSTVAFDPIITITGVLASVGVSTGQFADAGAEISDWTSAGAAATALVSDTRLGGAKLSIFLVDSSVPVLDSTNAPIYAQTDANMVIVAGAQLEYGRSRPSTLMPTQRTASRAADAPYFNLSQIPYDNAAVTLFSEVERIGDGPCELLALATVDSYHSHELDSSSQSVYQIVDTSVSQASITDGVAAEDTVVRMSSSAVANDATFVVDSVTSGTDTSLTMPDLSGGFVRVGSGFDGYIRRVMVIPSASDETTLQDMGVVIDPLEMRYIEKLCLRSEAIGGTVNKMADSGAYFAGPVSSVTCSWLAERTDLVAWATDANGDIAALTSLSADVSGVIALGGTYTDIWIGIGYRARYKSGKLDHGSIGGSALTMPKKIDAIALLLENTHRDAVRFGQDFERMRQMNLMIRGRRQSDSTVYGTFDDQSFSLPGRWDTDSRLCIEVNAPLPATFLGLIISENWNERGLGTK